MFSSLESCNLFSGLDNSEIRNLLSSITYQVKNYTRGDVLVQNTQELGSIKIIVTGSVKGEMIDFSGKTIKIEDIEGPRCLAPAFMFGKSNRYPVDIVANNNVQVVSIPKADFLRLLAISEIVLHNYLDIISNKAQFLSGKLKFLSFQSIKGKLAHYLLSISKETNNDIIRLSKTHSEISELFGVTRPSLSRALRELDSDGIIKAEGKTIKLIDKSKLSALLR